MWDTVLFVYTQIENQISAVAVSKSGTLIDFLVDWVFNFANGTIIYASLSVAGFRFHEVSLKNANLFVDRDVNRLLAWLIVIAFEVILSGWRLSDSKSFMRCVFFLSIYQVDADTFSLESEFAA